MGGLLLCAAGAGVGVAFVGPVPDPEAVLAGGADVACACACGRGNHGERAGGAGPGGADGRGTQIDWTEVLVSDFHFDLPEELIAQHPPAERGSSRMLVVKRAFSAGEAGQLTDELFQNLPLILGPGDLLILNDSRVLPARLYATRAGLTTQAGSPQPTGLIEVLLTEQIGPEGPNPDARDENLWRALVKPARKVQPGETLHFFGVGSESGGTSEPVLSAEVVAAGEFGERTLRFAAVEDFYHRIARIGHMPLPPYIHREQAVQPDTAEDRERYQTVYSQKAGSHRPGSAAAPTAGLHFTPEILGALEARGVEVAYLTLHVGLGTFQIGR